MNTLFIDSSMKNLRVAFLYKNKLLFSSNNITHINNKNFLMEEIIKGFEKTNTDISNIDSILVVNGPGSFTGIRTAVTIAKTIAWALKKQLNIASSLEIINNKTKNIDYYVSILDERKDYAYIGIYDSNKEKILEEYLNIDKIAETIKNLNNKNVLISYYKDSINIKLIKEKIKNQKFKFNSVRKLDLKAVIKVYSNKNEVASHAAMPNYIKLIDIEKKKLNDC